MTKSTILFLPKDGKEKWTKIMEGELPELGYETLTGQPIVMSTAAFNDGFWVAAGVYKSEEPEEYNIKFVHVYTPDGQQIPFLIDPSDHEDFRQTTYVFYLNEMEEGDEYIVEIKEWEKEWFFGKSMTEVN